MIVTLNRKVRDRIPVSVPEVAKKCSPPRPGTGAPRGRKPNKTALPESRLGLVPVSRVSEIESGRFSLGTPGVELLEGTGPWQGLRKEAFMRQRRAPICSIRVGLEEVAQSGPSAGTGGRPRKKRRPYEVSSM